MFVYIDEALYTCAIVSIRTFSIQFNSIYLAKVSNNDDSKAKKQEWLSSS